MARTDNTTDKDRTKGRNSQSNRESQNESGSSKRGLASADKETRQRVAREGGRS